MKLAILSLALLAPGLAFAQAPTFPDEATARCIVEAGQNYSAFGSATLALAQAQKQIADLKAQIAKLKEPPNDKQNSQASPDNGGGGARP